MLKLTLQEENKALREKIVKLINKANDLINCKDSRDLSYYSNRLKKLIGELLND